MDPVIRKRMVTLEQLNSLLELMKEHPQIAKGLHRGMRGVSLKVWHNCAKKLNAVKHGAAKNGKGWSKYWCDWKYRVRRRALELIAAKNNNKPSDLTPLSAIEETILSIIGETSLNGVVIKTDPLADMESMEDISESKEHDIESENEKTSQYDTKKRKRKFSREPSYDDAILSPLESKVRLSGIDLEDEDEATQFLKLEREKLEHSRKLLESTQTIATELTKLTEIMSQIKDVLVDRHTTK